MDDAYANYRFIIYVILDPIITTMGIIGNILCLSTICYRYYATAHKNTRHHQSMSGKMYTYLCGLAFTDLGYLAFNLQTCIFGSSDDVLLEKNKYILRFQQPTWNALKATSDFIVICMTIDRCRMISNIAEERLGSLRRQLGEKHSFWPVCIEIVTILILCFTLHLPQYFTDSAKHGANCTEENAATFFNETTEEPLCSTTILRSLLVIYDILYVLMVKVLPVVLIVSLNCFLVKKLKLVWERRQKFKQSLKQVESARHNFESPEANHIQRRSLWSAGNLLSIKEQRMAFLLVAIAMTFLVFTLPANLAFIWYTWQVHYCDCDFTVVAENATPLFIITNFFESFNYSINFYMYCGVHKEIRNSFWDMSKCLFSRLTCREFSSSLTSNGETTSRANGETASRANGGTLSTISIYN